LRRYHSYRDGQREREREGHAITHASVKKPTPATKQTRIWNHLWRGVRRKRERECKRCRHTRRQRYRFQRGQPYAVHRGRHIWSGWGPCRRQSCEGIFFRRTSFRMRGEREPSGCSGEGDNGRHLFKYRTLCESGGVCSMRI